MFRYIAVLALVLVAGCHERAELMPVSKCGQPCYTKDGHEGVGQCQPGIWHCKGDDEDTAVCVGDVGPEVETCDLIDNNCDGRVDEGVRPQQCSSVCGIGYQFCTHTGWSECTARQPSTEVCDGKDNDCDGLIDEAEDLPISPCYDAGTPDTLKYGACRPGVTRCVAGQTICEGQVGPTPETCNNIDDNCNGQVDEGTSSTGPVDIVFVIDNSGSMQNTINAVKLAVAGFSSNYAGRPEIRWALVGAPSPDPTYDGVVRLEGNLADPVTFSQEVQTQNANGGGSEPTLDAIYDLTVPMNPLGMLWAPGSRHVVILFTDELPQSWFPTEITYTDTNASIIASGTDVYVFTTSDLYSLWGQIGPPALVQLEPLTALPSVMEMALTQIIMETTCR